jgi:hypothetical protein
MIYLSFEGKPHVEISIEMILSDRAKSHGVTVSALFPMSRGARGSKYSKVEKCRLDRPSAERQGIRLRKLSFGAL